MAEQTLAQPLSGEEIVQAIQWHLGEILQKQCHLNPALAYESFSADIRVSVRLKDLGREIYSETKFRKSSDPPPGEDAALIEAEKHLHDAPPNEVRMQTDQSIPVLTTNAEGKKEIKNVKYEKQKTR